MSRIGCAAHFYLTTGYMPMEDPYEQPRRASDVEYTRAQIDALVAYVDSLGGGPGVPTVDTGEGDLEEGFRAYTEYCAGCHQVVTEGGVVIGAVAGTRRRRRREPNLVRPSRVRNAGLVRTRRAGRVIY